MSLFRVSVLRSRSMCRCLCLFLVQFRTNVAALPVSGTVLCERWLFLSMRFFKISYHFRWWVCILYHFVRKVAAFDCFLVPFCTSARTSVMFCLFLVRLRTKDRFELLFLVRFVTKVVVVCSLVFGTISYQIRCFYLTIVSASGI